MPEETEHIFEDLYKDPNSLARPGRVFYFSRHGESDNNLYGKIGGDANLSVNGQKYANLLAAFLNQQDLKNIQVSHIYYIEFLKNIKFFFIKVWHSEFVRTGQTATMIDAPKFCMPQLNEINAGL